MKLNKAGPNTDPWGTLLVTGLQLDSAPLMTKKKEENESSIVEKWTEQTAVIQILNITSQKQSTQYDHFGECKFGKLVNLVNGKIEELVSHHTGQLFQLNFLFFFPF